MSIAALEPTYNKPDDTSSYASPKRETGLNQFLTLLVAQLKHQDPFNPMESTEFTAQLAQFSSLEQLFAVNENLIGIQKNLGGQQEEDLIGLIGKTVKAEDTTILVKDGSVVSGSYTLEDRADVTIVVYDSNGQEVRTFSPGWKDAGDYNVEWNGRDNNGDMAEDGIYTFEVSAKDESGHYVTVNTYITGEVTGVTYEYGLPYLMIGDRLVSTNYSIVEVRKTEQTG